MTSSSELAGPQAEELKPFYDKFNVTSANLEVESSSNWSDRKKEIYKSQVLYGSVTEYEADILRDEYGKSGIRSKRPFDIALVDEVDSMLIDGKNYSVRLSSPMPGMSELVPILGAIWIHLGIVATRIHEEDGKVFYVEDPNDPESVFELKMSKFDFLKKNVEDHVRLLLRDRDRLSDENRFMVADYPEIEIPVYVKNFVFENRIQRWVENAIYAKFYHEKGRDYVIEDNKIKIVDAKNTGVIHDNMSWGDGLHQFLQMKHGSKISAEQMTTNFISNPTFFMRYGKNIYGLSGTLGSNVAQEFLRETYEVKLIVIPPFKMKLHIALEPIICGYQEEWLDAVASSSIAKLQANRSCLVIAESINEADDIAKTFRDKNYPETKILMYTTDKAKAVIQKKIKAGEVIISTNLSGRGTDIKLTDEVNANGGLHLCLTFLPTNDRVELQNLGRTSRTGNPGTSQFVLLDPSLTSLQAQQARRDAANVELFKSAASDMKRIVMRAKVFEKFCVLLDVIKGPKEGKEGEEETEDKSKAVPDWGEINRNGCSEKAVAEATEERFGFWLKANESTINNPDEYLQKFEQFQGEIKADAGAGNLVRNPFYYVRSGKEFLNKKEYDKAEDQFTKGIDMDLKFAANGYYNRAFTMIEKYGETNQTGKIDEAINDFRSARTILEKRKTDLLIIQQACTGSDSSELADQVAQKANLLDIQISAINRAVGYDNDSLRTQIEEMKKHRGEMEGRINNFVPLENLQANFNQVERMYMTLKQRYSGGNGELDKVKARRDELENKVLSFQNEENLRENISNINSAIEDAEKKMREQGVLTEARGKNRSVKISRVKLDDILNADIKAYEEDITEVERNGYLGSFEISEVPPVDWWAVIGVFLIGLAQMVAGAAIAIFSFGAASSFGIGMIMEGVSDVVTAVRDGIINRNFDWKNWGIMKAISYTVSIVVAGLGALKNIVSAAYSAVKGAVRGAATVFSGTVKEGWKLAGKKVGIELSKGVARELAVGVINYGLDATLMVEIEKKILEDVRPKIQRALLNNEKVKKLLLVDELNKNHFFEDNIKKMAMEILQSPSVLSSLTSYATGVSEGVASQKSRGIGNAIEIVKAIAALSEALNFVDAFMSDLKGKIDKSATDEEVDKAITTLGGNKISMQETTQTTTDDLIEGSTRRFEGDVDLSKGKNQEIVKSQYKKSDQSHLVDKIAEQTAKSISFIVKGRIIAPATYAVASFGANKLSASLDAALNKHVDLYKSKRRLIQVANNDRGGLLDKSFKQNHQKTENVKKVDSLIQDVKSGNELGLVHMGPLTEAVGRSIQVLDNKGKILFTVGKAQKGQKPLQAQFHPPTESRPQGHWTLPNGREAPNVGSGINDCLLNVVCAQVPGRPYELRGKLAQKMEAKKDWLANAMPDYLKLQRELKSGLFEGGARYPPGTIEEIIDFSNDNHSHNPRNPGFRHGVTGHPRGHIPYPDGARGNIEMRREDRVQTYSLDGVKSSLSTAEESYTAMNALLQLQFATEGIARLNARTRNPQTGRLNPPPESTELFFTAEHLTAAGIAPNTEVLHYSQGEVVHRSQIQGYTMILRHRHGESLDANAPIFIQTAFPDGGRLPQEIFIRERARSSSQNNRGRPRGLSAPSGYRPPGRGSSGPPGPRPPGRDTSAGSPNRGNSHVSRPPARGSSVPPGPRPPGRDSSGGSPVPGSSHVSRPPGRGNPNNRLGRGGTSPSPLGRGASNSPSGGGGPQTRPRGNSNSRPWGNSDGRLRGNSGGRGQDSLRPPPP